MSSQHDLWGFYSESRAEFTMYPLARQGLDDLQRGLNGQV